MGNVNHEGPEPIHDRTLLLHGPKRDQVLSLGEVQRYGVDSFSDPDYIRLYGMRPVEWYARGVRLLGRTAVECTRDALGDLIGRDVAEIAARSTAMKRFVVIDPFAGSCNTLYWILRHVPNSMGIAFELDRQIYELSKRNLSGLGSPIELANGDYRAHLETREFPSDHGLIVFIAPPWGTALDEAVGLDLRRTTPPITEIIGWLGRRYAAHKVLFATQVYEKLNADSVAALHHILDWSQLRVYDINVEGRNHGVLLGTKGWVP